MNSTNKFHAYQIVKLPNTINSGENFIYGFHVCPTGLKWNLFESTLIPIFVRKLIPKSKKFLLNCHLVGVRRGGRLEQLRDGAPPKLGAQDAVRVAEGHQAGADHRLGEKLYIITVVSS